MFERMFNKMSKRGPSHDSNNILKNKELSPPKTISLMRVNKMLDKGNVFLRSIKDPDGVNLQSKHGETNWELEVRKILRKPDEATLTSKENKFTKDGNPDRSTTLMHKGARLFTDVGYGIVSPDVSDIKLVSSNMELTRSGVGKKDMSNVNFYDEVIDKGLTISGQLDSLRKHSKTFMATMNVNEVIMDIREKNVNIIFYKDDKNFEQAKYMQKVFKEKTGTTVPIFKYSQRMEKFVPSRS